MKRRFLYTVAVCFFTNIFFGQLNTLNDEFSNANLDASWNLFQEQYFTTPVPISNGKMQMSLDETLCNITCVWWQINSAGFIYKSVSGDFDVATAVYAKQKTNPSADINNDTQLAGLLARSPASVANVSENYVFNVTGMRFDNASIELKSTLNNTSTIRAYTDNMTTGTNAEVRMVRTGSLFELYSRPIGSTTWIFRDSFDRPDLPNTLHVGLIAYTFESYPGNLLAEFDYIHFSEVVPSLITATFDENAIKIYQTKSRALEIKNIPDGNLHVKISNIIGQKIMENSFNSSTTTIEIPKLNSGIYLIQLQTNLGTFARKIHLK